MELATVEAPRGARWWKAENREDRLRHRIRSGMKYEDIAVDLGTSLGSVCAKADRLGIGRGQPPQPFFWHGKPTSEAKEPTDGVYQEIEARQKAEAEFRDGLTISLVDSDDHHCRFVIGDPAKGRICGVRRKPGSFYCKEHHARCASSHPLEGRNACGEAASQRPNVIKLSSRPRASDISAPLFPVDVRTFDVIDYVREPAPA